MRRTYPVIERVRCPVCGRKVKAYIPRDGDGTAVRPYRHTNYDKNEPCQGKFKTILLDGKQLSETPTTI